MTREITVLHVDDDPMFRDLAAELLERADEAVAVRSESDPTAVPERVAASPIDCVVSDLEMPQQDGLELCRQLRRTHPELPFFLFTNRRGPEVVDRAMEAGVTDYIRKETGTHHYTVLANRIRLAVSRHRTVKRSDELSSSVPASDGEGRAPVVTVDVPAATPQD